MAMNFSNPVLPPDLAPLVAPAVPLSELTTLKVGGPAALVCRITTPQIALRFHALARKSGLPYYILGAGSNVLAQDEGYRGLIFRIEIDSFTVDDGTITAGAGLAFDDLIVRSLDADLTGLEFASGIPGTLGGAIMGNAGCYGHEIGEFVARARVLTPEGRLETLDPDDFGFQYRITSLRETGTVLLGVTLRLAAGDVAAARRIRAEHIADRRAKHPVDMPCAGSWFRNLPPLNPGERRRAAGKLLDIVGARTMNEGDARVWGKHANIIVNTGHATSRDISRLAARMRDAVQEKFGVQLEEEVRRLPAAGQV